MLNGIFRDKKAITKTSFAILGVLILVFSLVMIASVDPIPTPTITTDKEDYAPEETVLISGKDFAANAPLLVKVIRPDNSVVTGDGTFGTWPAPYDYVTAYADGTFQYSYILDGIEGTYNINILDTNENGAVLATESFTDSRTITSVTLNGGSSVTVAPGATITVAVNVNTSGGDNDWESTRYKIGGFDWSDPRVCVDTPDHTSSGSHSEIFTITAPSTVGNYDFRIRVYEDDDCDDGASNIIILTNPNGIHVQAAAVCGNGIIEGNEVCEKVGGSFPACCNTDCTFKSSSAVCRTSGGVCDIAETCTGSSATCPTDQFVSAQTQCRGANQGLPCDAAEYCSGTSAPCPADGFKPVGTSCADGLFCNGDETCNGVSGVCQSGTPVSCSVNNIPGIETCDNNPDSIHATFDLRNAFTSICNEEIDSCTTGSDIITHTCSKSQCGATCDAQNPCAPSLSVSPGFCAYPGQCLSDLCLCSYSIYEKCPAPGTVEGTGADALCYYGTQSCTENGCGVLHTAMGCKNYCDPLLGSVDNQGPVTSALVVDKVLGECKIKIESTETDTCSNVAAAEYFLGGATCGAAGTGTPMNAKDGNFNSLVEEVIANNIIVSDGGLNVHVRGQDAAGNWGVCESSHIDVDCFPPNYPTCAIGNTNPNAQNPNGILLNGQCNPTNEVLVCDNDPALTANICDSQSTIQLAEYFLDQMPLLDWHGINMTASDGSYLDEQCEDVQALINLDSLSEGTHSVQLHGKDSQESWGKLNQPANPLVSFIKDTTAPKTEKTLTPAGGISVSCSETTANGKTLTDGCAYVKQGTTITLNANDFNPDNGENEGYNKLPGEYADNVVIHYIIYWSYDGSSWAVDSEGQSGVNQDITLTLNKDSYHLIEYWATDSCGYAETHHYELDIVDTQAPVTTKEISQPKYFDTQTEKLYVDGVTTISFSCTDPQPHPVDNVDVYYRYRIDGGNWNNWIEYTTPFSFPEESIHEVEYYCVDALGNTEAHSCADGEEANCETDYVDHTKPITTKTYGTPYVAREGKEWITSQTPITLTAVDPDTTQMGCNSGVKEIKYKVTLVDDAFCASQSACAEAQVAGEFLTYSSPFIIAEQSCHLIEYYSIDNVLKTEDTKRQCVYVDNSAPITTKTIGTPQYPGQGFTWITKNTPITLSCTDPDPHPVDDVSLHARYQVDGGNWVNLTTIDGSIQFTFPEDSIHTLEWYCEDSLGNTEETNTEIDNVDTAPPIIIKSVDDNTVQPGDTVRICANVTDEKLTHNPLDPGVGVDDSTVWAKLVLGTDPYEILLTKTEGNTYCGDWIAPPITQGCHDYKCVWDLWVKAKDYLGNENLVDGIEIIVDKADPEIRYVLNPVSGRYYRDGKPFSIYAPAIDFGGDKNIYNWDNCKASGVYECRFYAVDYPYENVSQDEVKNYWDYLHTLEENVFSQAHIVLLGSVPYVNGVCQDTVSLPADSGITDKAFLAYEIEDNAGNIKEIDLAKNADDDYILMDIDNEGPAVMIKAGVGNLPGPLTSEDNIQLQAEIIDYESGFDECWADLLNCNGEGCIDTNIDLTGHALDYNLCEINGIIPNGLESGDYELKVNARDEQFNIGSDIAVLRLDNTRPTMGVISPLKGEVYNHMFPVSLHIEDSQSLIAGETVKFRISEMPAIGNLWCLGDCEDTMWVDVPVTTDPTIYSQTINLNEYGISGEGRYIFDAVACDRLYVPDETTDLGLDINLDRNTMHCRMISQHGAEEEPDEEPSL